MRMRYPKLPHHNRTPIEDLNPRRSFQVWIEGELYKLTLKPQLRKYLREYADIHFMTESEAARHAIRQLIVAWKEGKAI